jgi:hypothetical protein
MTELKPCPFCGETPKQFGNTNAYRCEQCGKNSGWMSKDAWNTRSVTLPSDELRHAFEAGVHADEMGIDYENGESVGAAFDSWLRSRIGGK